MEFQLCKVVAGLDEAVYSAAKNYLMEKQGGGGGGNTSWKERFRSGKGPPIDPSQWKYCELCKCTCAGELVNIFPVYLIFFVPTVFNAFNFWWTFFAILLIFNC